MNSKLKISQKRSKPCARTLVPIGSDARSFAGWLKGPTCGKPLKEVDAWTGGPQITEI